MITGLRGVLFDIDPHLFREDAVPRSARSDPRQFYAQVARPWLKRQPALSNAEVVLSGQGLHLIIWFTEPVEFTTGAEREKWSGIVKAVQAVLPSDPDAPGITATTRAHGSVNSKNGVIVEQLTPGKPVDSKLVVDLFQQLQKQPFRTIAQILFGPERINPCPVCREDDTTLAGLDHVGLCYGSCGKVALGELYDYFLAPRSGGKSKK
jgi:hypothetical protein